jgi:hypothetical protein
VTGASLAGPLARAIDGAWATTYDMDGLRDYILAALRSDPEVTKHEPGLGAKVYGVQYLVCSCGDWLNDGNRPESFWDHLLGAGGAAEGAEK